MTKASVKKSIYDKKLISIIRGGFSLEEILRISEALLVGGVKIIEVTLNSGSALKGIDLLQRQFGNDLVIGAGTVKTAEDVTKAVDAGSSFIIAPCLDLEAMNEAKKHEILFLPGIFTATEAQAAYVAGCETVKLFPADAIGPSYLKALRAPLNHIDFIPTGGVNHKTLKDFHKAGAVAFGVGSALVKNVEIDSAEILALTERARVLSASLKEAIADA